MTNLKELFEKDSDEKPILELTPLEKTAINTKTKEEYNELMRIYETGGWKFADKGFPTKFDVWFLHEEKTCVTSGDVTPVFKEVDYGYSSKDYYLSKRYAIISPQEFYYTQKITLEMIKKIDEYFEKRK